MSISPNTPIQSLNSYQINRSPSPEIQEFTEVEPRFLRIIYSAVDLLKNEEPRIPNVLLTPYLHQAVQETPQTELTWKIVSLIKSYSETLVDLGQNNAPSSENPEDFNNWLYNTLIRAHLFLDSQIVKTGIVVTVPEPLKEYLLEDPEKLCCFDYSLCQIGEKRAFLTRYNKDDLPGLLIDWGYQPTREMNSGDLVLYLDNGVPEHLGVYLGDGMIQSKWGNDTMLAYIHKLETTPPEYGNQIIIFRPPI